MMQTITIELLSVAELKPHEEINEEYQKQLLQEILNDQSINTPIVADKNSKVILDGHHRFSIAKELNLSKIPVLLVNYFDDAVISVFPRRKDIPVSKELIIHAGNTGKLFPNKSTRHVLKGSYVSTPYSLTVLTTGVKK